MVDAGKRATVPELERLLSKFGRRSDSVPIAAALAKPDSSVKLRDDQMQALEIEFLRLTERLTPWTRERLERTYRLGPLGFDALERVADLSAFQPPPTSEMSPDPAPDPAEQKHIFSLALTAGLPGLLGLPPYSLKSSTEHYNNGYLLRTDQNVVSDLIYNHKHKWQGVGPWVSTFSVQEGRESADRDGPVTEPGRLPRPPNFANRGEFGALPALVLGDIAEENFHFLRWERTPRSVLAVFDYKVDSRNSHYRVDAACGKQMPFHNLPGYQGTISVEPRTGAILRLTVEAQSLKNDPVFDIAAAVDYAPVKLGDAEANLPTRSLSFMTEDPNTCLGTKGGLELASGGVIQLDYLPTRRYNRVLFSEYKPAAVIATEPGTKSAGERLPEQSYLPQAGSLQQGVLPSTSNFGKKQLSVAELEVLLGKLDREVQSGASRATSDTQRTILASIRDAEISQSISEVDLTERLDRPRMQELRLRHQLAERSADALELVADLSALHEPPPADLLKIPAPLEDAEQRMLRTARDTAMAELTKLPNFFARRDTMNFAGDVHGPIRFRSSSGLKITFRDGREVIDRDEATRAQIAESEKGSNADLASAIETGLNSWGEFGSELVTVLSDTQQGSIQFEHWERSPSGPLATFRFEVPQSASHYQVNSDCSKAGISFHAVPAYSGSIWIDSENRVVRLLVEPASETTDPISGIGSIVEYARVQIGDKSFNRPQRSLTFVTVNLGACAPAAKGSKRQELQSSLDYPVERQLNRTIFSDYHRLGSTYRIVPEISDSAGPATQ